MILNKKRLPKVISLNDVDGFVYKLIETPSPPLLPISAKTPNFLVKKYLAPM